MSSSGTNGAPAHFASVEDVADEIEIQETILLSLEDGPQSKNTPNQIREAKQHLEELRRLLKNYESQNQAAKPVKPKHPMVSRHSYRGHSLYPTPASVDSLGPSSSALTRRKRTFPHLDDDDGASSRNKSLRTTPSPSHSQTGFSTPWESYADDGLSMNDDLIDLTGDDEDMEAEIARQRAYFARLDQQKADEKLAQSYRDHQGTPPGLQSPAAASTRAPAEFTAFDRLLGRPTQSAAAAPPPAASSSSQGTDHIASSNLAQGINNYAMPGSFDVEGTNTEPSFSFLDAYNATTPPAYLSSRSHSGANATGPADLFQPQFGKRAFPHHSTNGFSSPVADWARRAADMRQSGYGSLGGEPSAFASLAGTAGLPGLGFGLTGALLSNANLASTSAFDQGYSLPSMTPRPGTWDSGLYGPMQSLGSHHNGMNLAHGSALSDTISRTNRIDWTSGVDAFGRPIDDRLRNYYADLQDDPRKTQEEIKELLANIRPDEEIPVEDRVGTPESLRYPLYPHQQLALKWMTTCEEKKNKGGILADDMGLGKTISTLALMMSRQSPDKVKTTLIIAPVALVRQWEIELSKKVVPNHRPSVFMLHGKFAGYDDLRRFDVVLTTYGKLSFEEKRFQNWIDTHPGCDAAADVELARSCPLLHPKSKFYRVILDEAQCIKNVNTYSAKGACRLDSVHRWCLTGTPMMNGIHELYSLIKFLRIGPYNQQKEFNKMFGCFSKTGKSRSATETTRQRAMHALRALLRAIMLRRMKNSKLDGKPLLDLPPKTEEVAHVVFDEEERSFYTALESGARNTFNKYVRAGTVGKNYSNVLVLLLRLRQACCHPHLNLDVDYVGNNEASEESMKALARTLQPDVIARLKAAYEEGFSCPICLDAVIDPTIVLPCGHNSCSECFSTLAAGAAERNLRDGQENSSLKCPECRGGISPKNVINLSIFRAVHMPETLVNDAEAATASDSEATGDYDDTDDSDPESDSDDEIDRNGNLKDFVVHDDEIEDDEASPHVRDGDDDDLFMDEANGSPETKTERSKGKGKAKNGKKKGKGKAKKEEVKPHMLKTLRIGAKKNKADHKRYMKYLKKNWLPSAKVTECCRLLQTIQESGDKTIVFSQFTFLLDLLEIPVRYELGLKYCRYDGGMSRAQRDAAALDFQDIHSPTKVMLVSLKAGNAGLNLTSANHVIIMDPFWNPYIEMQAVDRAHRIGQQKPVQVHRLLVEGTVEDRIVELQEQKRQFVDAALDEGESKQLGRLSLQDLTYLFNGNST